MVFHEIVTEVMMRKLILGSLVGASLLLGACASEQPARPTDVPMSVSPETTTSTTTSTATEPEALEPADDGSLEIDEGPMTVVEPTERLYELEVARRLQEAKRRAAMDAAAKELSGESTSGR